MFTLHSRLLPNGFSWQLSQQSGLQWARWDCATALKECLQIFSVPLHQVSHPPVWGNIHVVQSGLLEQEWVFSQQSCPKEHRASPVSQLQAVFAVGCLTFIPWRRLGKGFGRHSTARWPGLLPLSCGEEQNQSLTQAGRENLSRLPCMGRVPAGTASNPVNMCLKVQCGWKAWGRRQKYMDSWRVRQVGTPPLHDAGWDIFYVHSMADLPCLQIPLHCTAMRSPNTPSKARNSFMVLLGWWGRGIPGSFVAPQSQELNPRSCSAAGFTPATAP